MKPLRIGYKHPRWNITVVAGYREWYGVGNYELLEVIDNATGGSIDHTMDSEELQFLTESVKVYHSQLADKIK